MHDRTSDPWGLGASSHLISCLWTSNPPHGHLRFYPRTAPRLLTPWLYFSFPPSTFLSSVGDNTLHFILIPFVRIMAAAADETQVPCTQATSVGRFLIQSDRLSGCFSGYVATAVHATTREKVREAGRRKRERGRKGPNPWHCRPDTLPRQPRLIPSLGLALPLWLPRRAISLLLFASILSPTGGRRHVPPTSCRSHHRKKITSPPKKKTTNPNLGRSTLQKIPRDWSFLLARQPTSLALSPFPPLSSATFLSR